MRTIVKTAAAAAATAVVGGLASRDGNSGWYAGLSKPPFQPPPVIFPIAWTALYTDIAVSSATVIDALRADGRVAEATAYERALAVNLVLNASWTWVFFRAHRLGTATVTAGALAVSCADLVRRAAPAARPAAVALAPYAGWCGFATVLSAAVWRRNR